MPFTTPAIVRAHLLTSTMPELIFEDRPVTLTGTVPVTLPHHNLVAGSVTVKRETAATLTLDHPAPGGYDPAALSYGLLARDSVLVALTESLATVFVEGLDYLVDYRGGTVRRIPGTTVPDSQPLCVYYRHCTAFAPGDDYTVDLAAGTLARSAGGIIPDGATVLVDYSVAAGTVEDDLIARAIVEAEDIIVRLLAPEYTSESPDQGLKTGATELALATICRAQAVEALSRRATADIPGRAKEWQQLSRFYEQQAWITLAPFLLPVALRSTYRQPRDA